MNKTLLIEQAVEASKSAYAPYSRFRVGAALLSADGKVYRGANVENRSYGLCNCAERSAVFSGVGDGTHCFIALAVYSPDSDYPISPCGACRQVLTEFMEPDSPVIFVAKDGTTEEHQLGEILPFDALHELKDARKKQQPG